MNQMKLSAMYREKEKTFKQSKDEHWNSFVRILSVTTPWTHKQK